MKREKTSVVHLHRSESLDFLGFTFRFDRVLKGRDWNYLKMMPSKKSRKQRGTVFRRRQAYVHASSLVQWWLGSFMLSSEAGEPASSMAILEKCFVT